jgi:hypothetical protein
MVKETPPRSVLLEKWYKKIFSRGNFQFIKGYLSEYNAKSNKMTRKSIV